MRPLLPATPPRKRPEPLGAIGDLARSLAVAVRRGRLPLAGLLTGETGYLFWANKPGAMAFALIAASSALVLLVWQKQATGLPVVPMLGLQHLLAYGLPIVIGNPTIAEYSSAYLNQAGWEVLIFNVSLALAWWLGMQVFTPSLPVCYALNGYQQSRGRPLTRLGLNLALGSTGYLLLQSLNLTDFVYTLLPAGAGSLIAALVSAAGMSGFFLLAMRVASGDIRGAARFGFWALLTLDCAVNASSFLLSSSTVLLASVALGLFWGNGRLPWRFLFALAAILMFFNAGKFAMRARYWHQDEDGADPTAVFTLGQMPGVYSEWFTASLQAATGDHPAGVTPLEGASDADSHSMISRINNLQNLLYVIRVVDTEPVALLHGATYAFVPELLIPRLFWPDKPRAHIAQEILNVHFGRQDLISTFSTYLAWGLLPEAYGNFGPVAGAVILGCFLGAVFAFIENFTARKLILSLEGLLAFALMVAMANSFEMVSTVLATSIEDSLIPIGLAALPFVRRTSRLREELLRR